MAEASGRARVPHLNSGALARSLAGWPRLKPDNYSGQVLENRIIFKRSSAIGQAAAKTHTHRQTHRQAHKRHGAGRRPARDSLGQDLWPARPPARSFVKLKSTREWPLVGWLAIFKSARLRTGRPVRQDVWLAIWPAVGSGSGSAPSPSSGERRAPIDRSPRRPAGATRSKPPGRAEVSTGSSWLDAGARDCRALSVHVWPCGPNMSTRRPISAICPKQLRNARARAQPR